MYKIISSLLLLFLMIISCDNPFLPETGHPFLKTISQQLTPEDIITQLFHSYETQRIELFTGLLSKDFKFYIAPGFDRTNMTYSGPLLFEKPDTFMLFVNTTGLYYYWGYNAELSSTTKLFSNADRIEISPGHSSTFNYVCDTSGDTNYVEVRVNNVTFELSRYEGNTLVTYPLVNQPQVFLLERGEDKLWKIKKWFDLGS
jgi:hypothetical protein